MSAGWPVKRIGGAGACRRFAAAATMLTLVALVACGGGTPDSAPARDRAAQTTPSLRGASLANRDQALQVAARGIVAPLYVSELAHRVLQHAIEQRPWQAAQPGARWSLQLHAQPFGPRAVLDGTVHVEIEAAHDADDALLRGESGWVRARLRFDGLRLGAGGRIDGEVLLDAPRGAHDTAPARRTRADAFVITDHGRSLSWSYLDVEQGARGIVRRMVVVADVPVKGIGPVRLDVRSEGAGRIAAMRDGPALVAGRYGASGVLAFLRSRLRLQAARDGAWTIDVDADGDGRTDYFVWADAAEARLQLPGL